MKQFIYFLIAVFSMTIPAFALDDTQEELRGLFTDNTYGNISTAELDYNHEQALLMDFARTHNYNTIIIDLTTQVEQLNIIKNIIDTAFLEDIDVYVQINSLPSKAAIKLISKVAKLDNLAGIIVDTDFIINPEFIPSLKSEISHLNIKLGMKVQKSNNTELLKKYCSENMIDFIMPVIDAITYEHEYEKLLDYWKDIAQDKKIYTFNLASKIHMPSTGVIFNDELEINYQLISNKLNDINGFVTDDYFSLKPTVSQEISGLKIPDGFNVSTDFAITRPSKTLITSFEQYFITGTSNPELALYMDGEEIIRETTNGTFGILVKLPEQTNSFVFTQGDTNITVNINKPDDKSAEISKITSLSPSQSTIVKKNGSINLSCVAPSGATVSASINGQKFKLTQAAATANNGIPATFTGTFSPMFNLLPEYVTNLGKAVYTLSYNGQTSTYTSVGNVYCVGPTAKASIEILSYHGTVYADEKVENQFITTTKMGMTDYITDETSTRFGLASGGYVSKSSCSILTGEQDIQNKVSEVTHESDEKSERIIIKGTSKPPFHINQTDSSLEITLFNTDLLTAPVLNDSTLIKNVEIVDKSKISLNLNKIWGYNVEYVDDATVIYLRKIPVSQSINGKTIIIDAGHGGNDPGAMGIVGEGGAYESIVNAAMVEVVKERLTLLGANIILTRNDDTKMSLPERLQIIADEKPDLFFSIHHNSLIESVNANSVAGMEIYYHEDISLDLAENIMSELSGTLNRNNRGVHEDYYTITRITYTPSVLIELGYLPNPVEYSNIINPLEMYKSACAISRAVENLFHNSIQSEQSLMDFSEN